MIVVADASPIICLARVGRLALVRDLFGRVIVPPAVRDEVAAGPGGDQVLQSSTWIEVRPVTDSTRVAALAGELDLGEASAIALAWGAERMRS